VAAHRSRKSSRKHAAALALLGTAMLALTVGAGPAGAILVKIHGRSLGVTPTNNAAGEAFARAHAVLARRPFDEGPNGGGPLVYHGGPVMHTTETHVIYWDPENEFTEATKGIVNKFFTDVAHDSGLGTNEFGVNGQFTDGTGNAAYESKFAGALVDSDKYPASACATPEFADPGPPYTHCLVDEQLQTELQAFIGAKALPKGPTQFFALLLPHKVVTCIEEFGEECSNNVFCAYHSSIEPGSPNEILYADIPFSLLDTTESFGPAPNAKGCQDDGHPKNIQQPNPDNGKGENSNTRFADVALKYISHEYSETITDPLASSWFDANGLEDGDKCNGVPSTKAEEGQPGFDKNSFLPTLGGAFEENNLFNQSINAHHFYIQSEWDNVAKACRMTPLAITGASFTSSPASPAEFQPVEFKGAATDPYGHAEFFWDFGDSHEGTGAKTTHTYFSEGSYTVTMTVKDTRTDATATPVKHTVTVDELPVASFTAEATTFKVPVKFDAKESEDPDEPPGKIETYTWDFGDNTPPGHGEKVEHTYAEPGEYAVGLVVEDSSHLTAEEAESVTVTGEPKATTGVASLVGQVSATLNASVTPNGESVTECKLEYGLTTSYTKEAPCSAVPGFGFEPVAVSAAIGGIEPGTAYHFRIVTKNAVGPGVGNDAEFTTLAKAAPAVAGEAASAITKTSATLGATVNPKGAVVEECKVEYGTSVFYEASAACASLPGGGTAPVGVSAAIGSLAANTTYHFRVVAKSGGGTGEGVDATFKTLENAAPPPPPPPAPNSSFTAKARANPKNGAITVVVSVVNPGRFSWLATFANGKFGAFSSKACKVGFVKLVGKCRPAKIVYAKGSATISGAGTATFTFKPSASARKALANARKRKKRLLVTIKFAFQSSLGGPPASATLSLTVKLKK
jgi:PKD repeat protein